MASVSHCVSCAKIVSARMHALACDSCGLWQHRKCGTESKRKGDEGLDNPAAKMKRVDSRRCTDLIVLGLPWKSTEEDLKDYFSKFGELLLTQVKRDVKTGNSKGFGFIRFKDYDTQVQCLASRHKIDGRWCEVNLPNSNEAGVVPENRKIFVARCTEELTTDDLREHFSEHGDVIDVFIPKPFRAFAFVTFSDPAVASKLCGEDHIVKGASVHISSAAPKSSKEPMDRSRGWGGGGVNFRQQQASSFSQAGQGQGQWGNPQGRTEMGQGDASGMNNTMGMNMLSSAMLAAAQAMFQGQQVPNPNSQENYQLGPGFGGTRDSRSSGSGYSQNYNDSNPNWSNRGTGSGGYSSGQQQQQQSWGQGTGSRGNYN